MSSPKTINMNKPKDVVVSVERLDQSAEIESKNPKQGVDAVETHGETESITSSAHSRERDTQDQPASHPIRLVRAATVPMTMEQGLFLRRTSEAAIEARLARIPGRVALNAGIPDHDPRRIARLRREQSSALAELKKSVMFQASEDMTAAMEDIDRRKMWKDLEHWE